jgi:hypothetical protein
VFALQNSLLEAAGADDLLNGFLASSALCRNERAAALWNTYAPKPPQTLAWSILARSDAASAAATIQKPGTTYRHSASRPNDAVFQ